MKKSLALFLFRTLAVAITTCIFLTSCAPSEHQSRDEIASDIASEFLYAFNTYDAQTLEFDITNLGL